MAERKKLSGTDLEFYPLHGLGENLPMTVKVLLESLIRLAQRPYPGDGREVMRTDRGDRVVWPPRRMLVFEPQ